MYLTLFSSRTKVAATYFGNKKVKVLASCIDFFFQSVFTTDDTCMSLNGKEPP